MSGSRVIHELLRRDSRVVPPRVGVGVRGGWRDALTHASYLTEGAVDNPLATARVTSSLRAGCNAFGGHDMTKCDRSCACSQPIPYELEQWSA